MCHEAWNVPEGMFIKNRGVTYFIEGDILYREILLLISVGILKGNREVEANFVQYFYTVALPMFIEQVFKILNLINKIEKTHNNKLKKIEKFNLKC